MIELSMNQRELLWKLGFQEARKKIGLWSRGEADNSVVFIDVRTSWRCYSIKDNVFGEPDHLTRTLRRLKNMGEGQKELF